MQQRGDGPDRDRDDRMGLREKASTSLCGTATVAPGLFRAARAPGKVEVAAAPGRD